MYVAMKALKTSYGEVVAGQEVRGAADWPPHILKATLEVGFIKYVPGQVEPTKETSPSLVTEPVIAAPPINCPRPDCNRTNFKNEKALRAHLARHK